MGQLADTYGFYPVLRGDSDAALKTVPNEGGESLLVGDMNEAWIFHIMRQASFAWSLVLLLQTPFVLYRYQQN